MLGLLAERPKHGYQIEQDIAERGMREWTEIGFSSIYYILNKLEAAGWLSNDTAATAAASAATAAAAATAATAAADSHRVGPARKVYHLTGAGWAGFQAAVRERLAHPRPRTGDFDLALANLPALPPAEARAALETYHAYLQERLVHVRAKWAADQAALAQAGLPFPPHVDALFDHSIASLEAEITWLDRYLVAHLPNL